MPNRRLTEEDVAWLSDDLPYLHPLDPIPALESCRLHARRLLLAFEQELQIATHKLLVARMGFARARRLVLALLEYQRDAQDLMTGKGTVASEIAIGTCGWKRWSLTTTKTSCSPTSERFLDTD